MTRVRYVLGRCVWIVWCHHIFPTTFETKCRHNMQEVRVMRNRQSKPIIKGRKQFYWQEKKVLQTRIYSTIICFPIHWRPDLFWHFWIYLRRNKESMRFRILAPIKLCVKLYTVWPFFLFVLVTLYSVCVYGRKDTSAIPIAVSLPSTEIYTGSKS